MSTRTLVYLDTRNRTQVTDDPFQCTIPLPSPIANISSVKVSLAIIPQGFQATRAPYNVFDWTDGSGVYHTATVASGSKTTTDLCTELTGLTGLGFSYNSNNQLVSIVSGSSVTTGSAYFTQALGVSGLSGSSITGTSPANVSQDTHIVIYLPDLPGAINSKIPAHLIMQVGGGGIIQYQTDKASFDSSIPLHGRTLSNLKVKVYDIHANPLLNYLDWVIILEVMHS